jgi:hypothetical protein
MVEVEWRLPLVRFRACSLSSSILVIVVWINLRPAGAIRGISGTLGREGRGDMSNRLFVAAIK